MKIVQYKKGDTELLRQTASQLPLHHGLRFPSFVDHYYGEPDRATLLLMLNDEERVIGTLGYENTPFVTPAGECTLAVGSNFHAFESGAGGLLFLHWLKASDFGCVWGGNENTQRVVEHQKWTRYLGADTFQLNAAYAEVPGEVWWRHAAKTALRFSPRRTRIDERSREMLQRGGLNIKAVPEESFAEDLLPDSSQFAFRFKPTVEHLAWRYDTSLDFVRYRLFRILHNGESAGYVILNEQPGRTIVAQCDATDRWVLTQGIFAALAQACRGKGNGCGIVLTSSCEIMKPALEEFGFRRRANVRPLAIGGLGRQPEFGNYTGNWLINFDWGDNGLRAPFLGQVQIETVSQPVLKAA
jgi:hypothetical protein